MREISRIERTLFTLAWLESPELRRRATAELNKGEARNALARAVCFHRLGRLRDRAVEAQQHRASRLALVTAAVALWNTTYLDRALHSLRLQGKAVPDELLAHLALAGWQHIDLTGDYLITSGMPTQASARMASGLAHYRAAPRRGVEFLIRPA